VSKTPKPVVHARDHEHGGPDTVRIVYESVGDGGSGGTGIQFDTDNEGGWLEINTNDTDAFGSGRGMSLTDGSGGGILVGVNDGELQLRVTGDGGLVLRSENGIFIQEESIAGANIMLSSIAGYIVLEVPDSDPAVAGAVWNNGGVLNISAG
jgi:hypothetical protein